MFHQKSTETVTLTRPQLQAILEIISQFGGIRSEPKPHQYRTDNRLTFSDISDNQSINKKSINGTNKWDQISQEMLSTIDWDNDNEHNGRASSLLMLNDSSHQNQLSSPISNESSKVDLRAESVLTTDTVNETNHRRYLRSSDSEFDWNEFHRKKMKALEYSRALAQQNQEKQKRKIEEQQRKRAEEQRLEQKIEEQRIKMRKDFERDQKLLAEKRVSAERKREAVIAAIERTSVINKRNFLVDSPTESQPVVAIKPQTRTREVSAQTEDNSDCPQYCEIGTQTDVQLLLYLLNEMNLLSKDKPKIMTKPDEKHPKEPKKVIINKSKKNKTLSVETQEQDLPKRGIWVKKQNTTSLPKNDSTIADTVAQNQINRTESAVKINIFNDNEEIERLDKKCDFRRKSFNISSSVENLSDIKNQRIKSSIDLKNRKHFLPQISARPHSRKKWYSHEVFDPNFLS